MTRTSRILLKTSWNFFCAECNCLFTNIKDFDCYCKCFAYIISLFQIKMRIHRQSTELSLRLPWYAWYTIMVFCNNQHWQYLKTVLLLCGRWWLKNWELGRRKEKEYKITFINSLSVHLCLVCMCVCMASDTNTSLPLSKSGMFIQ